jgi:soluble lytic murein transglycosylase-like protein
VSVGAASLALNCWLAAAERFNLPVQLLHAIAHVESGDDCRATHLNNDGSIDMGCMQVNSRWLKELHRFGITREDLFVPCVNIHVGAWILAQEVERYGYTWLAIGAYNAGPMDARTRKWKIRLYRKYAQKVLSYWRQLLAGSEKADVVR